MSKTEEQLERDRAAWRRYYQRNKEKVKAGVQRWKDENPEMMKAQYKRRFEGDTEQKYREIQRRVIKRHYEANKGAYAERAKKRKNQMKDLQKPGWAKDGYINLWYKFAKQESERTGRKVVVDHIIPLNGETVCGLHCEHNMQLLFAEDNASKSNKLLPQFTGWLGG